MVIGHVIDENGFFMGDILDSSGIEPDVTVICPNGFYRPKWNGTAWIEGLTQEEIDDIVNAPAQPSVEDRLQAAEELLLTIMLGG